DALPICTQELAGDTAVTLQVQLPQVGEVLQEVGAKLPGGVIDAEIGDAGQLVGSQGRVVITAHEGPVVEVVGELGRVGQGVGDMPETDALVEAFEVGVEEVV